MSIFKKKKSEPSQASLWPAERFEPVLQSSICTGEKTACMRDRETGKIHEIMLIRDSDDLARFAREYGADTDNVPTIY